MQAKRRFLLLLLAWLGAVLATVGFWAYLVWRAQPKEFRGTLRTDIMAIGGETTGVIIITSDGAYELDLRAGSEWSPQLRALAGKQVVVTGKLTVRKGIEVRERRIIHVQDLKPDTAEP